MASPVHCGAGIEPLSHNSDTTQTDLQRGLDTLRIDTAQAPKGLAGARSSITSATSEQPLPAQKNSTGINGFIAWLCNCCKSAPATELPRQESETRRPKQEQPPIALIRDFEEMPSPEQISLGLPHPSAFPPRSRAFSVEAPQATRDTQGIRGVQRSDETKLGASSSEVSESIRPRLSILLAISESEESAEGPENEGDVIPDESRAPERASSKTPDSEKTYVEYPPAEATSSAAPGVETAVLAESPPPPFVEESATEEPALHTDNACDQVTQTAPAASSSSQQGVSAVESESEQPI